MRSVFALLVSVLLVSALPMPALAMVAPPAESDSGSDGGGRGNRILTLFNLAGSDEDDEEEVEEIEDPRAFTLPTLIAPLSRDGRLTGYAYVQIRVRVADGENMWDMREDAHYALDSAVRAAFRNSVSNAAGVDIDEARAVAVWHAALIEHYGAAAIASVEIRNSDIRLLVR